MLSITITFCLRDTLSPGKIQHLLEVIHRNIQGFTIPKCSKIRTETVDGLYPQHLINRSKTSTLNYVYIVYMFTGQYSTKNIYSKLLTCIHTWLVVLTILKHISQLGWLFPYIMENKTCSKPPIRYWSLRSIPSGPSPCWSPGRPLWSLRGRDWQQRRWRDSDTSPVVLKGMWIPITHNSKGLPPTTTK